MSEYEPYSMPNDEGSNPEGWLGGDYSTLKSILATQSNVENDLDSSIALVRDDGELPGFETHDPLQEVLERVQYSVNQYLRFGKMEDEEVVMLFETFNDYTTYLDGVESLREIVDHLILLTKFSPFILVGGSLAFLLIADIYGSSVYACMSLICLMLITPTLRILESASDSLREREDRRRAKSINRRRRAAEIKELQIKLLAVLNLLGLPGMTQIPDGLIKTLKKHQVDIKKHRKNEEKRAEIQAVKEAKREEEHEILSKVEAAVENLEARRKKK